MCIRDRVVFSGVGKSESELRAAIDGKIGTFNVESAEELAVLDRVARDKGKRVKIALRVNPDVDPETHPYISTGLKQNKFGVGMAEAVSYTHLRAHETPEHLVCRLLLE